MDTLPSYLTAGGAAVTLAPSGPEGEEVTAVCGGCRISQEFHSDYAVARAKRVAARHAAKCRVIPQPEPWPAGVLHRAATRTGAHIDVRVAYVSEHRAECGGCGRSASWPGAATEISPRLFEWVDAHADACRFQLRPAVTA